MTPTSRCHVVPFVHRSGLSSASPTSPSVSLWVFQLRIWPCTQTPRILVGEPVFRTTICPAGLWSPSCLSFSINHRELLAVLFGVQGFLPLLQGRLVSLFADNTTAQCGSPDHPSALRASPCPAGSPVYPGNPQCLSGFSESLVSGPRVGVDLVSSGLQRASPALASDDRPVCDGVLRADVRPSVSVHGRHDAVMGWPSGLCLPSVRPSGSCAVEGQAIQGSGAHVSGSVLASAPLVSGPSGAFGGCSSVPSTAEGSTQTAALPSLSPEPPRASADCLSYIERSARAFGFSASVTCQLARCRRRSTRVNYQPKWAVFRSWCHRHGHSVSRPTIPKIASFLLYLRRSLSLSYSSIASYRPMLSGVFRFILPELSSHFVLRDLLWSFRMERHLSSSRVPPWDLSLVLSFVRGAPIEPLSSCSLRDLTRKVLFLVALATARRVGELHALSAVVSSSGEDLFLSYLPEFQTKAESEARPLPRSFAGGASVSGACSSLLPFSYFFSPFASSFSLCVSPFSFSFSFEKCSQFLPSERHCRGLLYFRIVSSLSPLFLGSFFSPLFLFFSPSLRRPCSWGLGCRCFVGFS